MNGFVLAPSADLIMVDGGNGGRRREMLENARSNPTSPWPVTEEMEEYERAAKKSVIEGTAGAALLAGCFASSAILAGVGFACWLGAQVID